VPKKVYTPKTKEQVKEEIERAEQFAEEHPTSMFGDDNVRKVRIFKRVCNEYLNGKSLETLRYENNIDADDIMEDDEEAEEENREIDDIINWLSGELDEELKDNEGHFW
jgi:hypothetical protein